MLIEKVEDGKEFPRCPDCGVALYQESKELSNTQKIEKEKWDNCDHEYPSGNVFSKCVKCGFKHNISHIPMARLMRCPKCAALYHVEG